MEKLHFQKLQNRHKLCILKITLFAYDHLFEQQRNSHDEYLVNKNLFNKKGITSSGKNISNQGADITIVHHLGSQVKIQGISQNAKKPGANLRLSHLGHWT